MNELYCGIDLHSNNNVIAVSNEEDDMIYCKRLKNDLDTVLKALLPYRKKLQGIVVESTFNWYWLVDGLMKAGYHVHLANTSAIQQYEGLKYGDDESDSRWLAKLLRLEILPEGYIYPAVERPVRDLLRKRGHLVRQRTSNILSIQNLVSRNTGENLGGNCIKRISDEEIEMKLPDELLGLAVKSSRRVIDCLSEQIKVVEKTVLGRAKLRDEFKGLMTVSGIGKILALTIMLETGEISRFDRAGNYASYARCVNSKRISNKKRKGSGNRKNGNKHLSWAFVEAANFAVRYDDKIKRYYQRKRAKTLPVVAFKAVAHKLARACFYIIRDGVAFDVDKAFD